MNLTTKEIENQIEKARDWKDMQEIFKEMPRETLRQKVDGILDKKGKSIRYLADSAGISVSGLYAMLNGDRPCRKETLIKIAFILELSLEELNDLLKLGKLKELYAKNVEDAIVIFGIRNKYPLSELDKLLEEKKCKLRFEEFRE